MPRRTGRSAPCGPCPAPARRGWQAAERHPAIHASSDFAGSGGYGDRQIADERFWAAAELFATTGDPALATVIEGSPLLDRDGDANAEGFRDDDDEDEDRVELNSVKNTGGDSSDENGVLK